MDGHSLPMHSGVTWYLRKKTGSNLENPDDLQHCPETLQTDACCYSASSMLPHEEAVLG
jgi:hypothetical protein